MLCLGAHAVSGIPCLGRGVCGAVSRGMSVGQSMGDVFSSFARGPSLDPSIRLIRRRVLVHETGIR